MSMLSLTTISVDMPRLPLADLQTKSICLVSGKHHLHANNRVFIHFKMLERRLV